MTDLALEPRKQKVRQQLWSELNWVDCLLKQKKTKQETKQNKTKSIVCRVFFLKQDFESYSIVLQQIDLKYTWYKANLLDTKRTRKWGHFSREKTINDVNPEMAHMLELPDKYFKVADRIMPIRQR